MRIDTCAYQNCKISPHYDSLIAKLIVHANDRREAIHLMQRALGEFIIEGINTTIPFHLEILKNKDFYEGNINTQFLQFLGAH